MKEDFFFDETCDNYLRAGEQMVWRGHAQGIIPLNQWAGSGCSVLVGILLGMASNVCFPATDTMQAIGGSVLVVLAFFAFFRAVMPPIRMLATLRKIRYVITTERLLILHGIVVTSAGQILDDPQVVRSISREQLAGRTVPTAAGTIWLGNDIVVVQKAKLPVRYGLYACSEPEGAEMEIRRLLGELPLPIEHSEPVLGNDDVPNLLSGIPGSRA